MPSKIFDVVIAGGGLVGLALAKALSDAGLTLAIVTREEPQRAPTDRAPQQWDVRVYAISPGSEHFLRSLGVWPGSSERLAPVTRMRVFGDRPGSKLEFDAYQSRIAHLATIVENRVLMDSLHRALSERDEVEWLGSEQSESVQWDSDTATLCLQSGRTLCARLLVGADGADSWLRKQAGIEVSEIDYEQSAVVANFDCTIAHRGTAFQWFRDDGVLALLPLPGERVSMVWSAPSDLAQQLVGMSGEELEQEVFVASEHTLGALRLITPPASFPLRRVCVAHLIGPRLALVGDAAHNFHPLAGQGVNVGFQDVRELACVLRDRGPERDVGASSLLRRYERARREDILIMTTATHALQRLFNRAGTPLAWVRNLGLNLTDRLPPLKSLLVRRALGSPIYHD